jgi:hypothetical protein
MQLLDTYESTPNVEDLWEYYKLFYCIWGWGEGIGSHFVVIFWKCTSKGGRENIKAI